MSRKVELATARLRLEGVDSWSSEIDTGDQSIVQQQFKDELDVGTIVRRYGMLGQALPSAAPGLYGDFTGVLDYESAVEVLERVDHAFMQLPAELREEYGNDPGRLVAFMESASAEDLVKAGLVPPPVVPVAEPVSGAVAQPEAAS